MDATVRDLKTHLSAYLRRVADGESVTVKVRRRPVARLVPVRPASPVGDLARLPGVRWSGRKPKGLERPQRLPKGVSLARWVAEDRR